MNKILKVYSSLFLLGLAMIACCWSCTPAADTFPKELKERLLGTWGLEQMLVVQLNRTTMRWDTVPNLPASDFTRATLTFRVDGTYSAFDPTYNRTTNRGTLFFSRLDFVAGWSRNYPTGGIWEFIDNYTTLYFDRGVYEANRIPSEKWVIEEFTDTRLRLYKDATLRSQRVWYTFVKRD